jgi:hypothetical protein
MLFFKMEFELFKTFSTAYIFQAYVGILGSYSQHFLFLFTYKSA